MGRLGLLAPLAWRNLWRNPRRTYITLAVVAVGVWSILSFDVVMKAFVESSRQEQLRLLTGEGQIHAPGYLDDPSVTHAMAAPDGALLARLNGPSIAAWALRVRVPAIIQSEHGQPRAITLLGVSPPHERQVSDLPSQILAGRYLAGEGDIGIVVGQDLVDRLKTRLGRRVVLLAPAADGHLAEVGATIVGVFGNTKPAQDEFVFTGLAAAQSALGMGSDLSEISFDAAPNAKLDSVVAELRRAAPGLDVQTWMSLSPLAYMMQSISGTYVGVWLLVMFVLMAIGIVNTQLMAVFERTREFGLMQALGMRPRLILAQVMLESALLIGLGVAAGVVLMIVTLLPFAHGLDLGFLAAGAEMAGASNVLYPKLDPVDAALYSGIVWLLGVGAALWPARRAASARPVVAMAAA